MLWLAVLILLLDNVYCSVLSLTSSPREIKLGLTSSLTLNCSLADNVTSNLNLPTNHDALRHSDDAITRCMVENRDVAHTSDNIIMLTSLVIVKDGAVIATVNPAKAGEVLNGWTNVLVEGTLEGQPGPTGFIQLTITDPTVEQTGEFVCEAVTVGSTGHGVILSTSVKVASSLPSVLDIGNYVRTISRKTEDLARVNEELVKTTMEQQNKIEALEIHLSQLRNKSEHMVFFNARIEGRPRHYKPDQVVPFNEIVDIEGSEYNPNDGLFTCTVSGFYHFSLACLSESSKRASMKLLHNGKTVFYIYSVAGYSYQTGANAGTIKLMKGDDVHVESYGESIILGEHCNFSGHLIKPL